MDNTKRIKWFVALELFLVVASVIVAFSLESQLPPLLQEYLTQEMESEFTSTDSAVLFIAIPFLVIYFVSTIGILLTKPWAKNLYIFSVVSGVVFMPFMGPTVDHAISSTINYLATLTMGIVLALLLFTHSVFNKPNQQDS
ncbi:hypothetical protein INR79_22070 [Vibrio sp. SCSIO 43132]|uniref:hypothetical protein n=1 Tax=Vibrio sp. SCSIO 43132 TaxID=2779363 RepID=UPI001CA847DB|nr:hypothetical protein [Vibrio sp. SCSIO 43132]UAB73834.1 hypothetical protein INR79_22070 [Vibrio sp. SCSIO 43132]